MNKQIHPSFRLWISKLREVQLKSEEYFLGSRQVRTVILQGIIVYLKHSDILTTISLDDSTGIVICTYYHQDYTPIQLKPGDLISVCGRITVYQQEYRLKLLQPPNVIQNFDEEIEWALSVKKLWREVYTVQALQETGKELLQKSLKRKRGGCIFDAVRKIRDLKAEFLEFPQVQEICGDNCDEFFLQLIQEGFLVQFSGQGILDGVFRVSSKVFHPKEVIKALFELGNGPLSLDELLKMENGKFSEYSACVIESLEELLSENYLFEVSDYLYDKIIESV